MKIYLEPRDWWIGYYRGDTHHYVCLLPCIVIRWYRRTTVLDLADEDELALGLDDISNELVFHSADTDHALEIIDGEWRCRTCLDAGLCCPLHNRNCEPPAELCCWRCPEAHHGIHDCPGNPTAIGVSMSHHDGSACVLDKATS